MYPTFKIHGTQDTFTIHVRYIWDTSGYTSDQAKAVRFSLDQGGKPTTSRDQGWIRVAMPKQMMGRGSSRGLEKTHLHTRRQWVA